MTTPCWEVKRSRGTGEFWAHLKAANGKTVHVTELYVHKAGALNAIAVIERAYDRPSGFVRVVDLTGKPS